MKRALLLRALLLLALVAGSASAAERRVVSIGGGTTEIVYRLGAASTLVGVDSSSLYPPAAAALPQVGYQRALSAEGILSLRPELVLAGVDAGPPVVIQQIAAAGVRVVRVPNRLDESGVAEKVRVVATALGRVAEGEQLVATITREIATALAAPKPTRPPRVLFVYARGAKALLVSGRGTAADAMIALSGAVNAVDAFEGMRPLTAEAVVGAAPDVILVPADGEKSIGGREGLLALPGVALTPAGRSKRIVAVDDLLLLGFGPRLGQAIGVLRSAWCKAP